MTSRSANTSCLTKVLPRVRLTSTNRKRSCLQRVKLRALCGMKRRFYSTPPLNIEKGRTDRAGFRQDWGVNSLALWAHALGPNPTIGQ